MNSKSNLSCVWCLFGYYPSYHHYFLEGVFYSEEKANESMERYKKRTKHYAFIVEVKMNCIRRITYE